MKTVHDIAMEIVKREGGFSNDPADPGGPTNHGVTLATLQQIHPGATISTLRHLTKEGAAEIFMAHYYFAPRIDKLPEQIQANVFDMMVNSGSNAIRILQNTINKFGQKIVVDGVSGPKTEAAAGHVQNMAGSYFNDAYAIARRNYYFSLAERKPAMRKFAMTRARGKGGWIKRAESFMSPKYKLSKGQFERITKGW